MLFMNRWEVEEQRDRLKRHPVLGPASQFLYDFMQEVDSHSDGWCYWKQPVQAAKKLMALLSLTNTATEQDFRSALRPIKSFYTRLGYKAGMKFPEVKCG